MIALLLVVYGLSVLGLLVYGLNAYVLVHAFRKGRDAQPARLARIRAADTRPDDELPCVTVQLPVYNERWVVERLIDTVCALDWPADRLVVQVLDDSTDETSGLVAARAALHRRRGIDVRHVRRTVRTGFKAGALAEGLKSARGDLLAIFDADFVPAPDFLRRSVPFFADERLGLVQARWGHLDRDYSWLTRLQGLAIDGHFGIEQAGRCWGGWLLNFNGTAGIWRRAAIDGAGGWTADTLTEDLDLSYRAQLAGWGVEYLIDTEVPAEIPADMTAFKSQQYRWAKGSIQTARKLLPRVLAAPLTAGQKIQAVLHLTHYLVHPLMLAVATLAIPLLVLWDHRLSGWLFAGAALTLLVGAAGPSTLYVSSQRALGRPLCRLADLPLLMLVGTGIAVSNGRAVVSALLGRSSPFVRTPKRRLGDRPRPDDERRRYRLPVDPVFVVEAALSVWCACGLVLYLERGQWLVGPFLALYAGGFGLVAVRSLIESLPRPATTTTRAAGPPPRTTPTRGTPLLEEPTS